MAMTTVPSPPSERSAPSPSPRRPRVTSPSEASLDALTLTVLRRLDGLLAGDHAGLLPGHGSDRGEARRYVPGDDPRRMDWAVTARTTTPHVRDTIADHELELWLVLDASSSLAFGTARSTKFELGWAAAGAFALLASRGGNRVGALRASSAEIRHLPARSGRAHVAALLSALSETPDEEGDAGDLAGALERVGRLARRRGMVVVVSDFLGAPDWERPLRALAHRHDVVAVEVLDRRELELPDVGLLAVVDPESGRRRLVDTSSERVRDDYAQLGARRRRRVADRLASCGAEHLALRTDEDWVLDLVRFVGGRRRRSAAATVAGGRR